MLLNKFHVFIVFSFLQLCVCFNLACIPKNEFEIITTQHKTMLSQLSLNAWISSCYSASSSFSSAFAHSYRCVCVCVWYTVELWAPLSMSLSLCENGEWLIFDTVSHPFNNISRYIQKWFSHFFGLFLSLRANFFSLFRFGGIKNYTFFIHVIYFPTSKNKNDVDDDDMNKNVENDLFPIIYILCTIFLLFLSSRNKRKHSAIPFDRFFYVQTFYDPFRAMQMMKSLSENWISAI